MSCNIFKIVLILHALFFSGYVSAVMNNESSANNDENEIAEQPNSWLKSAQTVLASPAGHVAINMAKELLNRSTGNSQVLSLNLTNLLIIVLLKILIFAAGLLGAGHWSSYGYVRSAGRSDGDNFYGFDESEAYLITGFLASQGSGISDCLYAAACNNPGLAYEYAKAGKSLLEGIERFEAQSLLNDTHYQELIVLVERAAYDGYSGVACNTTMKCDGLW